MISIGGGGWAFVVLVDVVISVDVPSNVTVVAQSDISVIVSVIAEF